MDDKYMLSIIIPHYNTPDLLKSLLSTIPDKEDIQTIVVDDHSDEEVKTQLNELKDIYANSNTLFLDNTTPDHNAGAARNVGLKHAQGKWLLFADADDYFLDGFYDIVREYFNTDFDIVFFVPDSIQLDTGEKDSRNQNFYRSIHNYIKNPCRKAETTLRYSLLATWSKLIRRLVVKTNKIRFASKKYANDVMFSVKTGFYAKKIAASDKTIYCVTRHASSLTTHLDIDAFDMRVRERIRAFQFLKNNLSKEDMLNTGICQFAYSSLFVILQRRYGIRCFIKYFCLFISTGTFYFKLSMLNPVKIIHWFIDNMHDSADEQIIKERYEAQSRNTDNF